MAELSVGIDLGTTNSCISTCWPNGQPRLLRDDSGVGVIPSVVSFVDDGRIEVGPKAKMRLLADTENTFSSVKRFIGRDMRLEENRWAASQYPYALDAGQNGIPLAVTRDKKIPIYQLSGHVLSYLKTIAEDSLDQPVNKAVITVPANFNEVQRRSTHQAGEFAGFEVLRIFNEPTAAALAYGLGKEEKKVVAVYDFGGGTFDITILRLEDPVFEVMSTSGDMLLGGDDFDRHILDDMLEEFTKEYRYSPEDDTSLVQRFRLGAERMKCQLTDWIVTAFEDRHIKDKRGGSLPPFHYEINRDKFRGLVGSLVDRSFESCDEAFELAHMAPTDVDEIILVGGTTRIPFLRERVQKYFGQKPLDKIQPDVVVSIGAAIQAFSLAGGDLIYPAQTRDMLPIRKVAPRPPAPKPQNREEMEILDDLSDDMMNEEEESIRALSKPKSKTMKGMAAIRPSAPGSVRPPAPQPIPRVGSASSGPDKTIPFLADGSKSSPPPGGSKRPGKTLPFASALTPPVSPQPDSKGSDAQLPATVDRQTPGSFELEQPFDADMPVLKPPAGGQEFSPDVDAPEPSPDPEMSSEEIGQTINQFQDPPGVPKPAWMDPSPASVPPQPAAPEPMGQTLNQFEEPAAPASVPPQPAAPEPMGQTLNQFEEPVAEPESQPSWMDHPAIQPPDEQPAAPDPMGETLDPIAARPTQMEQTARVYVAPMQEPQPESQPESLLAASPEPVADVAMAPLTFPDEKPDEAPQVTPEMAAQPYIPQDVIEELKREEAKDAAEQHDVVADAISGMADAARGEPARAPLLLDVTPNTLGVATVGGFVEVLIKKNSPVPIEKGHLFTTSVDNQERAVIKVLEGESPKAGENHVLGEVELVPIRQAPRGEIKIEVTYEITVDGILQISGRNLDTGEAQSARLTLFGG